MGQLMLAQSKFLKELNTFIERGSGIAKQCSDQAVEWSKNNSLAVDLHHQYIIWKLEFTQLLERQELRTDAQLFRIENTVPLLKGGIEYSDKDSIKSRALIKAISLELDEKLRHVREVLNRRDKAAQKTRSKTPKHDSLIFVFNRTNGELNRYPETVYKKPCTFEKGDGRYKLMEIFIEEKEVDDRYISTTELTDKAGYKKSSTCRKAVGEMRTKIATVYKDVGKNAFIESKQSEGYRIAPNITISFEDTP